MHPDTTAATGSPSPTGGVSPLLDRSTTFGGPGTTESWYGRSHSPTLAPVEAKLGELEGATAMAFASGLTAWSTLCLAVLRPGDIAALPTRGYFGTDTHATSLLEPWGVTVRRFDPLDLAAAEAAAHGAKLLLIETPSNPGLRVVDIQAVSAICRNTGTLLAVDNTVATPLLQRPLDLGADVTWQSASKYLAGHSDVLAGVLATRDPALLARLEDVRVHLGGMLVPDAAWLLGRGIRTLPVRLERQCRTALELAIRLQGLNEVAAVNYPGLPEHPEHALAVRQMSGAFGGLLSFELADAETADRAVTGLKLIHGATSLGGIETLIERRGRIEPDDRVSAGLLRLSVGVEHVDDIWADLRQAIIAAVSA